VKHIEALSGFMDRGDCSRIIDGDSAPMAGCRITPVLAIVPLWLDAA
jgi:hypothetical protein